MHTMQLIETILYSIAIGFFGSRVAVMGFDFMCYGGIFWKFKYNIAKSQGLKVPDLTNIPISIGHQKLQGFYDFASTKSFIIGLLDCKFCMTVWTSALLAVIIIFATGVSFLALPFSIIFGYLITEKI
jgi:hypothetical protein